MVSARYSEARQDRDMMSVVIPCVPGLEQKQLASVTKRFFTSCDWLYGLSTLVFGLVPIRALPASCVASPIGSMNFLYERISAPQAFRRVSIQPYMSWAIFRSLSFGQV